MGVGASAHDPYRGFKFKVLIPGFGAEIGFASCSGLTEETEIVEYREGTNPITMRKLPGLTSFENIVLSRGLSSSDDVLKWRARVAESVGRGDGVAPGTTPGFRNDVIIQLFDKGNDEKPVKEWRVLEAWPARLEIGDLDASSSDVVLETLELAHEGLLQTSGGESSTVQAGG